VTFGREQTGVADAWSSGGQRRAADLRRAGRARFFALGSVRGVAMRRFGADLRAVCLRLAAGVNSTMAAPLPYVGP
jgi:hypothetical protein